MPTVRAFRPAIDETITLPMTTAARVLATRIAQITRVGAVDPPSGKVRVRVRGHIATATAQLWDTDLGSLVSSNRVVGSSDAAGTYLLD